MPDESFSVGARSELEKQALDPVSLLGLGALSHVGANVAAKAIKKTRVGKRMGMGSMAAGIRRGMTGQELGHGVKRVANTVIGPESLAGHEIGRHLGKGLKSQSKGRQRKLLKKLRKNIASNPELLNAPYGQSMVGGINRVLEKGVGGGRVGKAMSVAEGAKPTLASRVGSGAVIGGLAVTEPSSIAHMGVNVAREHAAKSQLGQKFMRQQFQKGLEGKKLNKAQELATDLLLSPKALDTRRMGASLHSMKGKKDPQKLMSGLIARAKGNPQVAARQAREAVQMAMDSGVKLDPQRAGALLQQAGKAQGRTVEPSSTMRDLWLRLRGKGSQA